MDSSCKDLVGEQYQETKPVDVNVTNDFEKENGGEDSAEAKTISINNEVPTIQKDAIEILKVELVSPRNDLFNSDPVEYSEDLPKTEAENFPALGSCIDDPKEYIEDIQKTGGAENLPTQYEVPAIQNNAIEILKVELVSPRNHPFNSDPVEYSEDLPKTEAEKLPALGSCITEPVECSEDLPKTGAEKLHTLGSGTVDPVKYTEDIPNTGAGKLSTLDSSTADPVEYTEDIPNTGAGKLSTLGSCTADPIKYIEDLEPVDNCEDIPKTGVEKLPTFGSCTAVINDVIGNRANDDNVLQDIEMEGNDVNEKEGVHLNPENSLGVITTNSLSLLAQYQSDDDTDSVIEVPITSAQEYRNNVVEIGSSSDSDDSTDSSDVDYLNKMRKTIEKRIEVADDDDNDDDNEGNTGQKKNHTKLRVKGEVLIDDLPPIQDLQITVPEDECIEFGKIHSIVEQLVLVNALPNSILLDLETVIFLEKGQKVLGEVFDVLGQVADPLYCIRFNSNKQIQEKQIKVGDLVYVAPKTQYTQYVILSDLMKVKGSDASWENDVEPPPRFLDYSDDEQEQLAKRQTRNKDKPIDNEDQSKRPRTEENPTSNRTHNIHNRNRNTEHRNSRPVGQSYSNVRSHYNAPHQNQHRNSWHSNYYSNYSNNPISNYAMHSEQYQPQTSQPYPPHMPVYDTSLMHNMPYNRSQPMQYIAPAMFHPHGPQLMPNGYNARPPTLHGSSHAPRQHVHQQFPTSSSNTEEQ